MTVTHRISVEYKDRKRTKGDILRVDEHSIEIRLKPKTKSNDSANTIKLDSNEVHLIRSITVARKNIKGSTVFTFMISGGAFGFLIGNIVGQGGEEFSASQVGVFLMIPGLLIGTVFGIAASFETKTFKVNGDITAFEKALLGISQRLVKKTHKPKEKKSVRKSD